jgi:long-chain acyl-CoA synthetase
VDDALRRRASEHGSKIAAVMADGSRAFSYDELDARADAIAALFRAMGISEGETIALLLGNDTDVLALWWGARRAGLYYVPLGTKLTATELAYIVCDCEARAVIVSPELEKTATMLRAVLDDAIAMMTTGDGETRFRSLPAALRDTATPPELSITYVGRELIYSSGTTGRPKGIRRPLGAVSDLGMLPPLEMRMREVFRIDRDTIYLSVSPLYHATGRFLNRVVEAGGTVVILPAFDPATALAAIERHRVTNTQWVPTMFVRLLALPETERRYDLSSHRVALHAAAPCPVAIKCAMLDWWGAIVDEYYGGSENAGVTFITAAEWRAHPGSVGRSISGSIHILAEDGSECELPPGEIGLIYFDGGVPFVYMNAASSDPPLTTQLGYTTYGDLGHVDDDGYLYISDRRSDLIITGGVNVYPKEVELVLEAHPAVAEAAVIGTPDPEFGSKVRAVIVLEKSYEPTSALTEALLQHCRTHLSRIKCPRTFDYVAELPHSENGKLLKRVLRDRMGEIDRVG